MPKDKFSAVWVSHSSISDFLQCPRAYFLKNVYKDSRTGHKVKLMTPALALGAAVHEVLEKLSGIPKVDRFRESLFDRLNSVWGKYSGELGGFSDEQQEQKYKHRGEEMLRRVMQHPGVLERLAVKIQQDLPYYWLHEDENIILCGKIDWLEYLPESNSIHIIDFKTGASEEKADSLQLPIYMLLVSHCQERAVTRASYWYLAHHDEPIEQILPDPQHAYGQILEIARSIKLARQIKRFTCKTNGCFACTPMEQIINGVAKLVGEDEYRADVYILKQQNEQPQKSIIL